MKMTAKEGRSGGKNFQGVTRLKFHMTHTVSEKGDRKKVGKIHRTPEIKSGTTKKRED